MTFQDNGFTPLVTGWPVADWIAQHANTQGSRDAMIDLASGRRVSWIQMHDRVGRLAAWLKERGVGKGDRVGFLLQNTTDIMDIIHACWRIGGVALALNYRLTGPELSFIIGNAEPKVMFVEDSFADIVEPVRADGNVDHWLVMDGLGKADSPFEAAINSITDPVTTMIDQDLGDQAMLMYSSGTTGRPKGVIITHGMMMFVATAGGSPSAVTRWGASLAVMPMFHIGALAVSCIPTMFVGSRLAVMRQFEPGQALGQINDPDMNVTHTFAVPAAYNAMRMHPDAETTDFSRMISAFSGAESVPEALVSWWADRDVYIQEGFGMTETTATGCLIWPEEVKDHIGSAGKPLMGNQMRIVDAQYKEAPRGTAGQLQIRGPSVTPGYWRRPDATTEAFVDGWFCTGDVAVQDEAGYFSITDRLKDMYISGGENVYPAEVENLLYKMPEFAELAVIGVPDEQWGETGCVAAVLKPEADMTITTIRQRLDGQLAKYKWPKYLKIMDILPRNATGKVLKTTLRDQAKDWDLDN